MAKGTDYSSWVVFADYLEYFENYLNYYTQIENTQRLVECAAKGIFVYKTKEYIHPHQSVWKDRGGNERGIRNEVSDAVIENIMDNEDELISVIDSKDFDQLYEFIKKHRVTKFGGLEIYDCALRIGKKYDIAPKSIYLHGATLIGLRTLESKRLVEEDLSNNKTVFMKDLPEEFKGMTPVHIEDFLNMKRLDLMRI